MKAVIGNGLIGQHVQRIVEPDHVFTSTNIDQLGDYDTVYCAAPTSNRIWATQNEQQDLDNINQLIETIGQAEIGRFVLFSTCDTQIKPYSAYGKNRLWLETFVSSNYSDYTILRLPMIVHKTITKNILWDICNQSEWIHKINPNSMLQWFDLDQLSHVLDTQEPILNVCSEPILCKDIIQEFAPELLDQLDYSQKGESYNLQPYGYTQAEIFNSMKIYLNTLHKKEL